jgi:uncharacterized membrane protein YhaH (DUF805 family)
MDFSTAVKTCFNKFVDFSGRARRSEFWFFYLFTVLVSFAINILLMFDMFLGFPLFGIFGGLASLALILPTLAVTVRRLHDTGRSGWNIVWWLVLPGLVAFIAAIILGINAVFAAGSDPLTAGLALLGIIGVALLLPLAGYIVMFVFMVLDSHPGENKYGVPVK